MYQNNHIEIPIIINVTYKLNLEDLNQQFIDAVACVFVAYPGCLGDDGTIEFVLNNLNKYKCNIAYEQADDYIDYELFKNKLSKLCFDKKL